MTNLNLGQPVKNKYGVTKRQWGKWSNHAKRIFNDVYYSLRHSMQRLVTHPDALPMPKEHWETLRYNAAYLAADAVKKSTARLSGVQMVGGKHHGKVYRSSKAYSRDHKRAKRRVH